MNLRKLAFDKSLPYRLALGATLLLPLFLLYGRAIADILVTLVGLLFLLQSAIARDWRWTRSLWVKLAAALWLVQVVASIQAGPMHSVLQSLAVIRLFLFIAALEAWVLPEAAPRRWLWMVFAVLAIWVGVECWQQYLTGANIMGYPRWADGSLTGPFFKPRAGGVFLMLSLPGLLPLLVRAIQRNRLMAYAWGAAGLVLMLATMILIGQRMPNLLMVLALCLTGLLFPRLRRPLLVAGAVGIAALVALPVISPPTYAKLVVKFADQMSHFPDSPYGQLYVRAAVMTAMNPWIGLGFDGFREFCSNPVYFHDLPEIGITNSIGGAGACNIHPHNYYFEVAVMAGITGLLLFVAILGLWMTRLLRALHPSTDPDQALLLVTVVIIFWPIASTSSLFTFDTAGWAVLITGWALAASRAVAKASAVSSTG